MARTGSSIPSARAVREHQVLHIAADLPESNNSIEEARLQIVRWAQNRAGGKLPRAAIQGKEFEFVAAGRNSSAVEVNLPEISAWALRQEDPDKDVPGRIWSTEAILWKTPNQRPKFAARLLVSSSEVELDILHTVPGFVRQLVENVGLTSGRQQISARTFIINNNQSQDQFFADLEDPTRRLPIIVVSLQDVQNQQSSLNLETLATGLCGLAQIVAVYPNTSWDLTNKYGKRLSVFERAVRIYLPAFDKNSDPFEHPLWLGTRLSDAEDVKLVESQIRAFVAQFSKRTFRIGEALLPFAQIRTVSRKAEQDRLENSGASAQRQLEAAVQRIQALESERDAAKRETRDWTEEVEKALLRAEEAERRERNSTAQIQNLLLKVSSLSNNAETLPNLPSKWEDFGDWCDVALVGRVALTSLALRGCKKPLYSDIAAACRCLLWLANECRTRRIEGGGSLRDEQVEDGIRNSLCGSDEFIFDWQERRLRADWHIKSGGSTRDPRNCLRIYYGWDELTQQIIVADMPGHRTTDAS